MERIKAVAELAAALGPGKPEKLPVLLSKIVPNPLPPEVAYEVLLQSHLFFGYAQAIETAKVFSHWLAESGLQLKHRPGVNEEMQQIRSRGEQLCRKVYHPNFERLVGNMREVSPELADWMICDGYGKVLSRPGPTGIEREIASIVFLALSGHPVQLYSHVRGARNLGASADTVIAAISSTPLTAGQRALVEDTVKQVYRQ